MSDSEAGLARREPVELLTHRLRPIEAAFGIGGFLHFALLGERTLRHTIRYFCRFPRDLLGTEMARWASPRSTHFPRAAPSFAANSRRPA